MCTINAMTFLAPPCRLRLVFKRLIISNSFIASRPSLNLWPSRLCFSAGDSWRSLCEELPCSYVIASTSGLLYNGNYTPCKLILWPTLVKVKCKENISYKVFLQGDTNSTFKNIARKTQNIRPTTINFMVHQQYHGYTVHQQYHGYTVRQQYHGYTVHQQYHG